MLQQENQRKFPNVSGDLSQTTEDKPHKIMRAVPATILLVLSVASWFMYFNFYYEWNSERAVHWLPLSVLLTISTATIIWLQNKWFIPKNVSPFNLWIFGITIIGGSISFLLPLAIADNFSKDGEGTALRQMLIYSTGGLLGVITLGETRRKNDQEKEKNENDHTRQVYAERRSRYTKAVEQLANEKAAVRLGGIYTLVGLVDEWLADESLTEDKQKEEGQVIINNLCSYIRSPFPLAEKIDEYKTYKKLEELKKKESENLLKKGEQFELKALVEPFTNSQDYNEPEDITADYVTFHEEQNIRRTIFVEMGKRSSVISNKEEGDVTVISGAWSDFDFDFSQAHIFYPFYKLTIEKGNFSGAKFYADTDFSKATFNNEAHFREATFTSNVNFGGATFNNEARFGGATFNNLANFGGATFNNEAHFGEAIFKNITFFGGATFNNEAHFSEATFKNITFFGETTFNNEAHFSKATFNNIAGFGETTFTGNVDFGGAEFSENTAFWSAEFIGDANFKDSYFEKYAPIFADDSGIARFSNRVNWADSNFSVRSESQPIELGSATLGDKTVSIPFGTVVFDPGSWDEKTQEYTHMSVTCCRIYRSPHHQE